MKRILTLALSALLGLPLMANSLSSVEPSVELAKLWWEDQRNVWTPLSWPDHFHKFTVMYNGALIADPACGFSPRPHARPWIGENFLLMFRASADGLPAPLPTVRTTMWKIDGGHGIQGWNEAHETPVLWTEYRCQEGIVFRVETFSHITSNADVQTALEPEYAWIRISVVHVDPLRHPESFPFSVQLSRSYIEHGEYFEYAVTVDEIPERAPYPRQLTSVPYEENGLTGYRITEPDGKIRLEVLPTELGRVNFAETVPGVYNLKLNFKAEEGEFIDLLLPMLPQEPDTILSERNLQYEGALTMSDWYWNSKPETAAVFDVPEQFINDALKYSIKFSRIINEKDYENGQYSYLTGIWGYDALWATPTSMVSHMFMDQLGYFDQTEKYSEIFHINQGTVIPPGEAYYQHPGYFSTPKLLTSIDWLTDHGAVLHQVATHALLTDDKEFIDHWMDSILKACDFIKDMCSIENHGGTPGLLPPAVASDDMVPLEAVWSIAWNYKGLVTAVRLLERIGHPRAEEFRSFAEQYKETFVAAYRKIVEEGPTWIDSKGNVRYKPSTVMTNEPMRYHIYNDAFYLDTGPMCLVWAGLLEADDPIMRDCADFFREGPNTRLWEPMYHAIDRGCLFHEMSTCEPIYSWNNFINWKLGERRRYLEGMYSILVGAISQNTYISCEHRHGIQGNLFAFPMGFYLAKLSVIDDQIEPGSLHLLRLCPRAWITKERKAVFTSMPTEFGTLDLSFSLSEDGTALLVDYANNWRTAPQKVVMHIPPVPGLKKVKVNGKEYGIDNEIAL